MSENKKATALTVETKFVEAQNRITYAFRRFGSGGKRPLLLFQHFRGTLDSWDPALLDELAESRQVITFDNTGVGASSGVTAHTITQMAVDSLAFIDALELESLDLLGFSIGSMVAQEVTLIRPDVVNRLVLASSAPRGASGMHGWAPEVIGAVGKPQTTPEGFLSVFFHSSDASQNAGKAFLQRSFSRQDKDNPANWQTRKAQYDAVAEWGIPNHAMLQRVVAITQPTFIANGDSDPMILPRYSYLLAGLIPNSTIKIYPDAAHGFLFQHHTEFARDVTGFLDQSSQ
jgi:pimeloyl-ACP methyl ester carboxylesterase